MIWFKEFLNDINKHTGQNLTEGQLLQEIEAFKKIAIKKTPLLKAHYIDDLSVWAVEPKSQSGQNKDKPDFPGADLLLSFHDRRFPDVQSGVISRLNVFLEGNPSARTSNVGLVLKKEEKRRNKGRPGHRFWNENKARLEEKYVGYYALFRSTSESQLVVELAAFYFTSSHPAVVTLLWDGKRESWTADLLANTTKLSGTAVRVSTDKIIEPTLFSVLRTGRKERVRTGQANLLLSGLISGWIDSNASNIMCSRIAMVKLPIQPESDVDIKGFFSTKNRKEWQEFVEQVESESWPHRSKLLDILGQSPSFVDKDYIRTKFGFPVKWPVFK